MNLYIIHDEWLTYNDGLYIWDTPDIYHFEKYNMILAEDFVQHVMEKLNDKEALIQTYRNILSKYDVKLSVGFVHRAIESLTTAEEKLLQTYKDVLSKHEPYTPNDPEYNRFDGGQDPMRTLATEAKEYLEKYGKS